MKISNYGKIAAALLLCSAASVKAEEFSLGKLSDWQKSSALTQHAPNIIHGKGRVVIFSNKIFKYEPGKTYTFKGLYRQQAGSDSNIFRIGILPYGDDGKPLEYAASHPAPKSDTFLKKAVSPEDKSILVVDAAKWNKHCFTAFKTLPEYKDLPNRNLIRQRPKSIAKTAEGWVVTFNKAVGVSYPAGTRIRQHYVGSQFRYAGVGTGSKVLTNMKATLWAVGIKSFRVVVLSGTDGIKVNEKVPVLEMINPRLEIK